MSKPTPTGQCLVCTAPAPEHQHYGATSCYPCRSFFRRGTRFTYVCVRGDNSCQVDHITRKNCPKCRFDKCVAMGMLPQLVDNLSKRKHNEDVSVESKGDTKEDKIAGNKREEEKTKDKSYQRRDISFEAAKTVFQSDKVFTIQKRNVSESGIRVSVIKTVAVKDDVKKTISDDNLDMHDDKIDIETIVDDCFMSEFHVGKELNSCDIDPVMNGMKQAEHCDMLVLPYKKRPKLHHFEHLSSLISKPQDPIIGFTFEEEFRLHDLLARRDHLYEIHFKHLINVNPMIIQRWQDKLMLEGKVTYTEELIDLLMGAGREIGCLMAYASYDESIKLGKSLAYRCAFISSPATSALSMTMINAAQEWELRKQKTPSGRAGNSWLSLWEDMPKTHDRTDLENCTLNHSNQQPMDLLLFETPWAQSLEDEEFYKKTITEIGKYVDGDLKLTNLYHMLVYATPPAGSNLTDIVQLKQLQADLSLLLFRYLASKMENTKAAEQAHSLIGMIGKLHRCGDILLHRRIRMIPDNQDTFV